MRPLRRRRARLGSFQTVEKPVLPTEKPGRLVRSAERAAPLLEARGINVGYGALPVVHGLDLVLWPGEVVALLGSNGAGKTTTLLALSGELPLLSGELLIDGRPTKAPLHHRARNGLAFVPEERSVFKELNCQDNLRVGRGAPEAALEIFPDLAKRLTVRGGLLSGGEQQMLTLSRALAGNPRILLADELSLGLAPLIVKRLLHAVRRAADDGAGVVLVEQHVRQALGVADRALIMRRGRIELSGTSDEFRGRLSEIENSYLSSA